MTLLKKKKFYLKNKHGFGLIETLVGTAIFILIAISTYQVFGILMDAVSLSRTKISATSLANEQFEIIRNLPYVDVGIIGGMPAGKIQRTQTLTRDNHPFLVQTTIRSVDDPFDGTIDGTPADLSPADYKLVDLDISCPSCKLFPNLNFTTLVAPKALETASTNGALFVRVFNFEGTPIQGAQIHIVNTQTTPGITIDETTDNEGWLKIVDAIPGTEAYSISATKSGYSTDKTYQKNGDAGPDPIKLDATVVVKQVTQLSFSIDRLSSFLVSTIKPSCEIIPNINFSLTGAKLIGTPSVLKYTTHNFTTNALGQSAIPDLEWDSYLASLQETSYDIAGTIPINPISLSPGENKTLQIITTPHLANALLVLIKDSAGNPIDDATVVLQKTGFEENKTTSSIGCNPPGQVFWNGLGVGTYNLTVTKAGYEISNNSINISSTPGWQNFNVTMTPQP
ncbi:MAG: hypothetical protein WCO07_01045 [bacterium]